MMVTRAVRTLALAALVGCGFVARASAQGCDLDCPGANSTGPSMIRLVAQNGGGMSDPAGSFTVELRDLANNPVSNAVVRVELFASDVVFCATQQGAFTQHQATFVEGLTDQAGRFTAVLRGHGTGPPQQGVGGADGFEIFGNGFPGKRGHVAAFDPDGAGGLNAGDLSRWLRGVAGAGPYLRG